MTSIEFTKWLREYIKQDYEDISWQRVEIQLDKVSDYELPENSVSHLSALNKICIDPSKVIKTTPLFRNHLI